MQVTPDQSLALVEYIAHLSVQDWNGIAGDLRKLGFIPPGSSVTQSIPPHEIYIMKYAPSHDLWLCPVSWALCTV